MGFRDILEDFFFGKVIIPELDTSKTDFDPIRGIVTMGGIDIDMFTPYDVWKHRKQDHPYEDCLSGGKSPKNNNRQITGRTIVQIHDLAFTQYCLEFDSGVDGDKDTGTIQAIKLYKANQQNVRHYIGELLHLDSFINAKGDEPCSHEFPYFTLSATPSELRIVYKNKNLAYYPFRPEEYDASVLTPKVGFIHFESDNITSHVSIFDDSQSIIDRFVKDGGNIEACNYTHDQQSTEETITIKDVTVCGMQFQMLRTYHYDKTLEYIILSEPCADRSQWDAWLRRCFAIARGRCTITEDGIKYDVMEFRLNFRWLQILAPQIDTPMVIIKFSGKSHFEALKTTNTKWSVHTDGPKPRDDWHDSGSYGGGGGHKF